MKVIGLMGSKGAGKDHFFKVADHYFGGECARFAFADRLRTEVVEAFDLPNANILINPSMKEKSFNMLALANCKDKAFVEVFMKAKGPVPLFEPRSPREIQQIWGTEYRRSQNDNYWVRFLEPEIAKQIANGTKYLFITDVRFDNEIETVRAVGELVAIRNINAESKVTPESHISERRWMECTNRVNIFNPYPSYPGDFDKSILHYLKRLEGISDLKTAVG